MLIGTRVAFCGVHGRRTGHLLRCIHIFFGDCIASDNPVVSSRPCITKSNSVWVSAHGVSGSGLDRTSGEKQKVKK